MKTKIFCKHCGMEHEVTFHQLTSPLYDNGTMYTHFAICPQTCKMLYGNVALKEYIAYEYSLNS